MVRNRGSYYTPRHRHNFDQIRMVMEGKFAYAGRKTMRQGSIGYFPEGTYYGPQNLHEVLERTTWHIGQHTRQWVMLLDKAGIAADRPLGEADFADLPMPKKVWDD